MDRQQLEELQRRAEASLKNNKVYQISSFLYFPGFVLIFVSYAFFSDKSWVIALCSFFFVISFVSFCVNCQIIINAKKRIKEEMKRQHEWED